MSAQEASGVEQPWAPAEPGEAHRWLQRMVGEWSFEVEARMGPDKPPERSAGTERVRSIGGLWIVAEAEADAPGGGRAANITTLGYDPDKGRYVGSFVSSMMAQQWVYAGDRDGDTLVLETEGPAFTGEGTSPYQDIVEFISDDERLLRSRAPGPEGGWYEFMTARYRRVR